MSMQVKKHKLTQSCNYSFSALFIYWFQSPPHNKVSIELNTLRNTYVSHWEFKIAFNISYMDPPKGLLTGNYKT